MYPFYTIILCVGTLSMLGMALYSTFNYSSSVLWSIVGMIIYYPFFVVLLLQLLICCQTMTISKEGFTIRICGIPFVQIKWTQIDSIKFKYNHMGLQWIVFLTKGTSAGTIPNSFFWNPPWYVKASKKNQIAIKGFAPKDIISF